MSLLRRALLSWAGRTRGGGARGMAVLRASSPRPLGESLANTPHRTGAVHSVQGGGASRCPGTPIGGRASPSPERSSSGYIPANQDTLPQRCVFISEEDKTSLCFGVVGSNPRFCVAPKDEGYSHCGVKAHRAGNKFVPQANCFYLPGGVIQGRHTARSDNCLPKDRVPSIMKVTFEEWLHMSRKWCHLIIDALTHVDNKDGEEGESDYGMDFNEEVGSKSTYTSYADNGMDINHDGGLAIDFDWDEEICDLGGPQHVPIVQLSIC